MSHISPLFRRRFSTFERLDDFLGQYDYDKDLLFRYLRYVPNDDVRYRDGTGPPDVAWTFGSPGRVWGELRAIPFDSSGNPILARAVPVSLDVHPPGKIPLPVGTVPPARYALPVDVPGFRPSRLRLVPPEQQFVNKALLLTDDEEYVTFLERAKNLFDAYYLKYSLGEVSRDRVVAMWDARWPTFHPDVPVPAEFQILDPDSPEWSAAYEERKREESNLVNYPPCEDAIAEISEAVNRVRAAPPGSMVHLASGAWRMPDRGYGAGKSPPGPRTSPGERYRVAPQRRPGPLRIPSRSQLL